MLLIIVTNRIQESCICTPLFLINRLLNYYYIYIYIYIYIYLLCNMNIFIYTQLQHKNVQSPDITYLVCPGVKYKNKIKNK